jgi:hypothetical protein
MTVVSMLYVRLIEGSVCLVPVVASENPDGTFHIQENPEFDPEDTSRLFEFFPGDDVRAEPCASPTRGAQASGLVAKELVRSSAADRDYWTVLFAVASGAEQIPAVDANLLPGIATRIRSEMEAGQKWHYPSVAEWAGAAQ